jgi:hypothetical protein
MIRPALILAVAGGVAVLTIEDVQSREPGVNRVRGTHRSHAGMSGLW